MHMLEQMAAELADLLFINGNGDAARRLVMELPDGRDGGGWCRAAVEAAILQYLRQHTQELPLGPTFKRLLDEGPIQIKGF